MEVGFSGPQGASLQDLSVMWCSCTVKCSSRREELTGRAQQRTIIRVMWKRAVHKRDTLHAGRFVGGV